MVKILPASNAYFSYGTNRFTYIKNVVEDYIHQLRTSSTFFTDTTETISVLSLDQHREFAERLQLYMDTIEIDLYGKLAAALYEAIYEFDDSMEFMTACAQDRILYIISELLMKCNQYDFLCFIASVKGKLRRINMLYRIYHYVKEGKHGEPPERITALANQCQSMSERIVSCKLDIYHKEYYAVQNAWCVLGGEFKVNANDLTAYVRILTTPENIYKILWDCVTKSMGSKGYGYSIVEESFNQFFECTEEVDHFIEINPPKNDDERTVLELYERYKHPKAKDYPGEKDLMLQNELKISL